MNSNGEFVNLLPGESGADFLSSGTCSRCWSEGGDFGIMYTYEWDEKNKGWNISGTCMTCGTFFKEKFEKAKY
jgi:hypothetical protein